MCGIAGIFSKSLIETDVVSTMLATIGYRGPDHREVRQFTGESGVFLTVGQARLAIQDLSPEANQPFLSQGGRTSLTFNGEFFNFLNLRKGLVGEGFHFRTNSDTEVALALLDQSGVEALPKLWGMFAGCYFREQTGEMLLFRDRFGQKPLYYFSTPDRIYFASEPKAILAVLPHRPKPDVEALRSYYYLGYVPGDQNAFEGLKQLPPGHALEIGAEFQPRIWKWYEPKVTDLPCEEKLEELFLDAVKLRMIADVPLAAFLSGGLDSSLVVAAMARIARTKVNTFSVRFEGPQALDESPFARMVARHCQTDHHEIVLNTESLVRMVPEVVDHMDEPFGDSSAVPMYLVSQAARRHFTVALSGDAADELFGGYRKYLGEYYLRRLGPYALRQWLWRPLSKMLPTGRKNRVLEINRRIRRLLAGDARNANMRHIRWLHMSPVDGETLLGPAFGRHGFDPIVQRLLGRLPANADLNDLLRFDQSLVLCDDMFVKVDRMSMKASLEVRSPFIDHRIVELANGLDPTRKLKGTQGKWVLHERLGHWLPKEILTRPKTGFEMPLGVWLRTDLKDWASERLFHWTDTSPWVDGKGLQRVWDAHQSGKLDCTEMLWHHLVFASWIRTYHG